MSTAPPPSQGPASSGSAAGAATGTEAVLRRAEAADLPAIVAMLADDHLGAHREAPDEPEAYRAAFDTITADPNQYLLVAELDGRAIGTLQLTLIPGLSHQGTTRAQIEGVRVHTDLRAGGLGTRMIEWAAGEARRRGAGILQLTSDATRIDTHRFYERLGFEASHLGFKLPL